MKTNSLIDYYDEVALPALLLAQVDLRRGVLDEPRQKRIKETIDEVIEDLSDHIDEPVASAPAPEAAPTDAVLKSAGSPPPNEAASGETAPPNIRRAGLAPGRESRKPVLCIAGRSFLDEAAAALFAQILDKHGIEGDGRARRGAGRRPDLAPFGRGRATRVPLILRCRFEPGGSPFSGAASAPAPP